MKVEGGGADESKDGVCSSLTVKITELEQRLREEEEQCASLRSELELSKMTATQQSERHKIEVMCLREDVSRSEEYCNVLRGREMKDRGRIEELIGEIKMRETEFTTRFLEFNAAKRDLECAEQRAKSEALEWKRKYGELEARTPVSVQLNAENTRAYDELRGWKKKFNELEAKELRHVRENSHLMDAEKKERKLKEGLEEELDIWKKKYGELESRGFIPIEENSHPLEAQQKEKELKEKLYAVEVIKRYMEGEWRKAEDASRDWKDKCWKLEDQTMRLRDENCRLLQVEEKERQLVEKLRLLQEENKDLDCAKRKAEDEILKMEGASVKPVVEIDEQLLQGIIKFVQSSTEKDFKFNSQSGIGLAFCSGNEDQILVVDNDGDQGLTSVGQKWKRKGTYEANGATERSQIYYSGYMTRSKKRAMPLLLLEARDNGTEIIRSVDAEDAHDLSFSGNTRHEDSRISRISTGLLKVETDKYKLLVADKGLWAYLRRNSKRENRAYKRRNVSSEDETGALERAEKLQQREFRAYKGRDIFSKYEPGALERAEKLKSSLNGNHPSFVKLMCPSYVSFLPIPTKFREENLTDCTSTTMTMNMTLKDEKGSENKVTYLGDAGRFCGGWKKFVTSHNLEIGDALVFELIEQRKFKVYIVKSY